MTHHPVHVNIVGWREWVGLPHVGVSAIKAKIDTGATTSALHAIHIERYRQGGRDLVRFQVHPLQRNARLTVSAHAPLVDYRTVRSSSGHETHRPVIRTEIELFDQRWSIELTLANRDQMGFRMLLGRQAIRERFLVDAGTSFRDPTRVPKKRKRKKRNTG